MKPNKTVKLSKAMLAWNPMGAECVRGGEPGQVGVCKHPDNGQLRHLQSWTILRRYGASLAEAKLHMMVEAWHLACRDEVPLGNIHEALRIIPEYRELLADDFSVRQPGGRVQAPPKPPPPPVTEDPPEPPASEERKHITVDTRCIHLTWGGYKYSIALNRIKNEKHLVDWMMHLCDKGWMNTTRLQMFAEAAMQAKGFTRVSA